LVAESVMIVLLLAIESRSKDRQKRFGGESFSQGVRIKAFSGIGYGRMEGG